MVSSLSIIVTWTQHIDQRRHFIQQHSQCIVIPFWSLTSLAGWSLKGINRGHSATMTGITYKNVKPSSTCLPVGLCAGFSRFHARAKRPESGARFRIAHAWKNDEWGYRNSSPTSENPVIIESPVPTKRSGDVLWPTKHFWNFTAKQRGSFSRTTQWWVLLKRDLDYTGDAVFFFFGFGSPESNNWFNKTLCTCLLQGKNLLS